jgi:hypothetical protein
MTVSKELLEKYRHFNVEHTDWWDYTYDDFKSRMIDVGIRVDEIYFSGFWSQGDGACFEGCIDNASLYLEKHHPEPTDYPMLKKLVQHGGSLVFKVEHRGHYYHEQSIIATTDADTFRGVLDCPTDFHLDVAERWDEVLTDEIQKFEGDAIVQFQGYMRELYRDLEAEYDHLTSDEAVAEAIEANELATIDEGE